MEQILVQAPAGVAVELARGNEPSDALGVSWPAVFGGAVVTASLSLILLSLGTGLGFSALSPWSGVGESEKVIGTAAIVWLMIMNLISGGLGGYLAGRLRTTWVGIHNDEVYFRDTAHGFLAWGLALVVTAGFLATAGTVMVGAAVASTNHAPAENRALDPDAYYVDMLFRSPAANPEPVTAETRTEIGRIFTRSMARRKITPADSAYVTHILALRGGVSEAAAQARLSDVFASAQEAADTTRKALAHTLLWIFAALLIGAFSASLAATYGGRQRDNVVLI